MSDGPARHLPVARQRKDVKFGRFTIYSTGTGLWRDIQRFPEVFCDQHAAQAGQIEHLADMVGRTANTQRSINRTQLFKQLQEYADACRTQERHLREIDANLVSAFSHDLGKSGGEVVRPIAIEPSADVDLHEPAMLRFCYVHRMLIVRLLSSTLERR